MSTKTSDQNATSLDLAILVMMPIAIAVIIAVDVWLTYGMLAQQAAAGH